MTTADNMVPVFCTLARHHLGDHDEHGVPGRKPCGAVVRYVERVAEEVCPPVEPEAVNADGHNHVSGIFTPMTCPGCAAQAQANPPAGFFPPPTPPAPVPAEPGTPEEHVQRVAEGATAEAMMMTVPAEPPPLAHLIAELSSQREAVAALTREVEAGQANLARMGKYLDRCISAVAQRAGKGALVMVGSVLFRSVPPRKPKGGEVAADALWRLELVEVAK